METQTTQTLREKLGFRRVKTVGSEFMSCNKYNPQIFVKLLDNTFSTLESKKQTSHTYINVVNLETGEATKMWVSGQLENLLTKLGETTELKDLKLEIVWLGTDEYQHEGETRTANQYSAHILA